MAKEKKEAEVLILDKKITDYGPTKYNDLVWAMAWARHLRRQEEFRAMTMAQTIEKAIEDIFTGKITPEEVQAAHEKDLQMMEAMASKKPEASKSADKKEDKEKAEKK